MAEYIEKATLLNRVIIPSICSCVQGPNAERLKKFCIDTVNSVPAADVAQVVHGRMKKSGEYTVERYQYKIVEEKCSVCEHYSIRFKHKSESNFCSRCGAKMDEVSSDE